MEIARAQRRQVVKSSDTSVVPTNVQRDGARRILSKDESPARTFPWKILSGFDDSTGTAAILAASCRFAAGAGGTPAVPVKLSFWRDIETNCSIVLHSQIGWFASRCCASSEAGGEEIGYFDNGASGFDSRQFGTYRGIRSRRTDATRDSILRKKNLRCRS
jgi:hypothetical protein